MTTDHREAVGPRVKFILVDTREGHLPEFDVAFVNRRAVLRTPAPIQAGRFIFRSEPKAVGVLYGVKPDTGTSPAGFFYIDLDGNGTLYDRLATARRGIATNAAGSES